MEQGDQMHPQEILLIGLNLVPLEAEASILGRRYQEALMAQLARQRRILTGAK